MGGLFATLRYDVCLGLHCVSYCKSCVSCQALAEALQQNSTVTYLALRGNNIGPEGAKAWCLVRMGSWGEREWRKAKEGSRHSHFKSDIREMTTGDTMQRWFPDAFIRLKFVMTRYDKCLGYFDVFGMYWPDPGWKEQQFTTILFPKQVTLSVSNFRSSNQVLNGIPNHMDVVKLV